MTPPDSRRALVAGAFLYSIGPAAILLMPMIVGVYVDELGFTSRQAGVLASVEAVGMCAASVLGVLWINKLNWRLLTLFGLGCAIVANLIAIGIDDFAAMLLCRACASLAAGTAFAVSVASLGEQPEPETAYGIGLTVQTFLMIVIMASAAWIIAMLGIDGLFLVLAALALLVAVPALWLPARSEKAATGQLPGNEQDVFNSGLLVLALIATVLHFIGAVAFWSYLERIGDAAGHSTEVIGTILTWALGAGLVGGLSAAWLGDRRGFVWPFIVSTVILIGTVAIAIGHVSVTVLAVSAIAFDLMWVFANAYQAALVAKLDRNGRYVVLVPAAQGAGAMMGPALAALFIRDNNFLPVNIIASLCFAVSLFLFLKAAQGVPVPDKFTEPGFSSEV